MIRRVGSSNIENFKSVTFGPGLNLIVANRAARSSETDTRNGVGKTLLIDIIHFCLGGSLSKEGSLGRLVERSARFFIVVEVVGVELTISRSLGSDGFADIIGMPLEWLSNHDYQPTLENIVRIKVKEMNEILGEKWYGLTGLQPEKFQPSFRPLIGFAARTGGGAFLDPFMSFAQMPAWQKQVLNTFLLRLGWEYATRWQAWKDKLDRYNEAKKAVEGGMLPGFFSRGELESRLSRLRLQHSGVQRDLDNFRVMPEYEVIRDRANQITSEMQSRQNKNVSDGELLKMYMGLTVEEDADPQQLAQLYEEAGVVLSGNIKRQLQEVEKFHHEVAANRRHFLEVEIEAITKRISVRQEENLKADREKSDLLNALGSAGALEEFTALQNKNAKLGGEISVIEEKIREITELGEKKSLVEEERVTLEKITRSDHADRRVAREESLGIFDEYIHALYNCNGDLVIDVGKNGFKFATKVDRDDAEGISKMKIFCYDLLLARIWAQRNEGPKFLIHDTTLFDGVEVRQRGHALELAWRESIACGFQYISFWNSDYLPENNQGLINLDEHVVLTLDDTEDGSLLGFRF